jgi:hypothetical protein
MRLLILSCSATKRHEPGLLPAIHRYDGSAYRLLRKALRDLPAERQPRVRILSAEFGLITSDTPIPDYDRRMERTRAAELAPAVQRAVHAALTPDITEVLISLGRDYLPALGDVAFGAVRVVSTAGGIGTRLGQMRRWLYQE